MPSAADIMQSPNVAHSPGQRPGETAEKHSHICGYKQTNRYFCTIKDNRMIVTFDKDYLRELYETGKGDKKHRFQPDIVKRYKNRIDTLKNKENIEALYNMASLHYEVLKGDKAGISSIRVNDQYRIEFTVSYQEAETIIFICNILDLSNHYQ